MQSPASATLPPDFFATGKAHTRQEDEQPYPPRSQARKFFYRSDENFNQLLY
jgi:hypothetical protein